MTLPNILPSQLISAVFLMFFGVSRNELYPGALDLEGKAAAPAR
jgi:hypothetical protein